MKTAGAIALLATAVMCAQNAGVALGVGWATIHGAAPGVAVAFVPLALGLTVLWGGYLFLARRSVPGASAIFTIYAVGLLTLNEMLLPMTPLRALKGQRTIDAIDVRDIRDEPLVSARGNPIGIRLTFELRVPETVVANVSASVFAPVAGQTPGPLQLARSHQRSIDPAPESEGAYYVFRKGEVYRFTEATLPNFLSYDEKTREPCLRPTEVPDAELPNILATTAPARYQTAILVSSEFAPTNEQLAEYVTSLQYDVKSMYQTIVREGNRRCGR
jgi:hypothetical protein